MMEAGRNNDKSSEEEVNGCCGARVWNWISLHCMSQLLARNGRADRDDQCPKLVEEQPRFARRECFAF
jgi:hypothetical protein